MSFPPYPKYKDSGVEWLGEVPEHWVIAKLGRISSISGGGTPSREKLEYWNGDIPWVSPKDMKTANVCDSEERITSLGVESSTTSICPSGCVLMVIRSGILKHTIPVGINSIPVAINQDLKSFQFSTDRCLPHFFLRWVQGLNDCLRLEWMNEGATVESFDMPRVSGMPIPLPPLSEQHAIATFLGRETAKIDALIAEQRRLIELLKEKRQAVISHAVTKGLNPNAPMKDSGIEWLGAVPEYWEIIKFGHLVRESPCYGVLVPDHDDDGVPMLRITDMEKGRAVKDDLNKISPGLSAQYSRTIVAVGDIALSVVGTIGEALIVDEELAGVNLSRAVARIQVNDRIHASYATTVFASSSFRRYIDLVCVGTAQRVLNMSDLVAFRMALPPVDEQSLIQRYVHSATVRLDVLLDQAEQSITLLQERRAALISAAVTGKIDVRGVEGTGDAA